MKTIISYILSIILAIFLIIFYFMNLASYTILNEEYILAKLEEEDYYNKIYKLVESNFENYIYQSGLEETVLDNIVSVEKIKNDTKIIIRNIYKNTKQEIDIEEIRNNLNSNIESSLSNTIITGGQKKAINTYIDHICNEYKTTISSFSIQNKIGENFAKIINNFNFVKTILLIAISIDFLLLFVLNFKRVYKLVSLIGMSLLINGFILSFICYYIRSKIQIKFITILNDAVSEVLRSILNAELSLIVKHGIVALILGIILIVTSNLLHNIKDKKMKTKQTKK